MDNTNVNFKVSSENLINIILCVNNIKSEFNNIIGKIEMININDTWTCNSSELIKKIFVDKLSFYSKECDDINLLIRKLINNLDSYMEIDKRVINLING